MYVAYHDEEWGVPVKDPHALFERLMLEGMQAGLSWYTVLKKRENMRRRFFGFDPAALASGGPGRIDSWLDDPGLIRHRGKLSALVGNAAAFQGMENDFGPWLWSFVGDRPVQNRWRLREQVPSETDASRAMSKGLKQAGFRFVGPTICYAFMQSVGMVNDHLVTCHRHGLCGDLGRQWTL